MTALLDAVGGSIDGIEKQYGEDLKMDEMSVVVMSQMDMKMLQGISPIIWLPKDCESR